MDKVRIFSGLVVLLMLMYVCKAEHADDVWSRDTLTGGFWGLNDQLADNGIEIGFGITSIYQANVKGGASTHSRRGRHSGSYDIEMAADMQKLLGIEGGSLYVHAEGWWSKSGGIDGVSVGSAFGVNADAGSRDAMVVTELWWEQSMFDDTLRLRFGKLDITGLVDRAVAEGRWLILVSHRVGKPAPGLTTDASVLEKLCEYIQDPAKGLWTGTVSEVGGYILTQRAATKKAR